jgi:ABC-type branched-subunit amino acid transport system ATPase component
MEQRARAALEISDHTYVLGGGRLSMSGTPAELSGSAEFVESFVGGPATAASQVVGDASAGTAR